MQDPTLGGSFHEDCVLVSIFFLLLLQCISVSHGCFSSSAVCSSTFHPDLLQTVLWSRTLQAFAGGPHTPSTPRLNAFLIQNLADMWARRCVFMCVSNGSASGQEWAAASGFPLMKAVSIYLRLNISPQRWMFLLLFFLFTFLCWGDSSECTARKQGELFCTAASSCTERFSCLFFW